MKILSLIFPFLLLLIFPSCGVDRADEQPLAPTVQMVSAISEGDSCLLVGQVMSSPNSSITAVGFFVSGDSLSVKVPSDSAEWIFRASYSGLQEGMYEVYPYATNGIGTTTGDTLRFEVVY